MKYRYNNKWNNIKAKVGDTLPIGSITAFGGSNPPSGWLICNGSAISRTEYASLFAIIGTTYGTGDGNTTFNLPNLQGKVLVGKSNETEFNSLGKSGGEKTHILTVNEMPSHEHALSYSAVSVKNGGPISGLGGGGYWAEGIDISNTITSTGRNQAHNNLQPYSVTNYIIKAHNNAAVVAKVEQDLSSNSEINVPSTIAVKTAIDAATKNVYSTEEVIIGKTNDNKNIYRKIVEGTFLSSSSRTVVDAIPDVKKIISCNGLYSVQHDTNPDQLFGSPQIGVTGQIDAQSQARLNSSNMFQLLFTTGTYPNNTGCYSVTIEYTKTTD